jgi:hypothetical protein
VASIGLDPLDVRLYAMAQASLLCSLLLCGAAAMLTRRPRMVFLVLGFNSLLHLLLDACEIKWGSGVHLLAPLSWRLTQLGWFWPDGTIVTALTIVGLLVILGELWRHPPPAISLVLRPRRVLLSLAIGTVYLALPLAWMPAVEASGSYSVDLLRRPELRPGRPLAVERNSFRHRADGDWLELWSGETLRLEGAGLDHDATVSLRGRFLDTSTVRVEVLHEHVGVGRDLPTYLALVLLVALWLKPSLCRLWPRGRATTRR